MAICCCTRCNQEVSKCQCPDINDRLAILLGYKSKQDSKGGENSDICARMPENGQ